MEEPSSPAKLMNGNDKPISPSLRPGITPPLPPSREFASLNLSPSDASKGTDAAAGTNGSKTVYFDPFFVPELPPVVGPNEKIGGGEPCAANSSWTFPTEDGRKITLTSMFCSGNMAKAEQFSDNSYGIWTAPDCANTKFETGYRTWFHFAVQGARKGNTIRFTVMNMNKQTGLFQFDHRPSFTSIPSSKKKWGRLPVPVIRYEVQEGNIFEVEFKHTFLTEDPEVRFAFCFPYSYTEVQNRLEYLDRAFSGEEVKISAEPVPIPHQDLLDKMAAERKGPPTKKAPRGTTTVSRKVSTDGIYYHREVLARSLEGRRLDMITITSSRGLQANLREGKVDGYFSEVNCGNVEGSRGCGGDGGRAHKFQDRKVVFMSARVHPGETPAQHVLEGALRFLLRDGRRDPRAAALRENFVFKIIPILNPDGVSKGHYRADTRGTNLNRMYCEPTREAEPTILASKTMVMHYFAQGRLQLYMDLHAHASKRGVFIYGNRCDGIANQIENMLFVRLMTINTKWLDFDACNFSEKNMKAKDRRDKGASKEGSGRVAIYHATNNTFPHSYTLECNYNTGRSTNTIPETMNDRGRASPPHTARQTCPKYDDEVFMDVGQGVLLGLLDLAELNPWSRLHRSLWHTLDQAKQGLFKRIRHSGPYREEAKTYGPQKKKTKKKKAKDKRVAGSASSLSDGAAKKKRVAKSRIGRSAVSEGKIKSRYNSRKVSNNVKSGNNYSENEIEEAKQVVTNNYIPSGNSIPRDVPPSSGARARSKIPAAVTNIKWGNGGVGVGCVPQGAPILTGKSQLHLLGPRGRNGLAHLQQKAKVKVANVGGMHVKQQPSRIPKPGNSNYSYFKN